MIGYANVFRRYLFSISAKITAHITANVRWTLPGRVLLATSVLVAASGCSQATTSPALQQCSSEQFNAINEQVVTDDGQGYGPDIGSAEWQSVVEFKLGIRGSEDVPARSSGKWCEYIIQIASSTNTDNGNAQTPSFDCTTPSLSSAETLVCEYSELAALDNKLSSVYAAALAKADMVYKPTLKATQRGWIKGRDECWKAAEPRQCIADEYARRVTALQAKYYLVAHTGPILFYCDDNPANEIAVTFFEAHQNALIAERGDSQSLMYQSPAASGSKYQGPNESFWQHGDEAIVSWGYNAPQMRCNVKPDNTKTAQR